MITEDSNNEPFFKGADFGVSSDNARKKKKKHVEVMKTLKELFEHYKNLLGKSDNSSSSKKNQPNDTWDDDYDKYMEARDTGGIGKSELDVYLGDEREKKVKGFDILLWWKKNSTRLPILSDLAKHILGMPVSSVASEAVFSTGGQTIDAY
ncbi:hypothetical protein AgCh_033910 [Apium graveolens]